MTSAHYHPPRERTPLWAVGIGTLLHVTGLVRPRNTEPGISKSARRAAEHRRRPPVSGTSEAAGRHADSPTEIPAKGWKAILLRVYHGVSEDRIVAISAGVTFFTLLALFPGIAGLIALYGLYADTQSITEHLNTLSGLLPEGGIQIVREQIERLTSQPAPRLGLAMIVGLGISLWSANGGMKAMFDALNVVYHVKETRSFLRLNAVSLAFTFGAVLFVLVALATITILPTALSYLGLGRVAELLAKVGRWPALFVVVTFVIALIYRFGPDRQQTEWRWLTPGSLFATTAWLAASLLFSWYAENFGSYNATYGSLGAAIGFMTWLWLSTIVILLGAKLNAEVERQSAENSGPAS